MVLSWNNTLAASTKKEQDLQTDRITSVSKRSGDLEKEFESAKTNKEARAVVDKHAKLAKEDKLGLAEMVHTSNPARPIKGQSARMQKLNKVLDGVVPLEPGVKVSDFSKEAIVCSHLCLSLHSLMVVRISLRP